MDILLIIIWFVVGISVLCTKSEDCETANFTEYDKRVWKDRLRTWKIQYGLTWIVLIMVLLERIK